MEQFHTDPQVAVKSRDPLQDANKGGKEEDWRPVNMDVNKSGFKIVCANVLWGRKHIQQVC